MWDEEEDGRSNWRRRMQHGRPPGLTGLRMSFLHPAVASASRRGRFGALRPLSGLHFLQFSRLLIHATFRRTVEVLWLWFHLKNVIAPSRQMTTKSQQVKEKFRFFQKIKRIRVSFFDVISQKNYYIFEIPHFSLLVSLHRSLYGQNIFSFICLLFWFSFTFTSAAFQFNKNATITQGINLSSSRAEVCVFLQVFLPPAIKQFVVASYRLPLFHLLFVKNVIFFPSYFLAAGTWTVNNDVNT